jgi:hypothetical protein
LQKGAHVLRDADPPKRRLAKSNESVTFCIYGLRRNPLPDRVVVAQTAFGGRARLSKGSLPTLRESGARLPGLGRSRGESQVVTLDGAGVLDVRDIEGVVKLATPMPGRVVAGTAEAGLYQWQVAGR